MKMRWMIYVGDEELQAMAYLHRKKQRILVEGFRFPMEDGCIRHGRVEKEKRLIQEVKECLAKIPFKIKRAELLLPSGLGFTKRMEVPKRVNRKQILYAVHMEFSTAVSGTGQILAYREGRSFGNGKKELLAASLERKAVEQYERVFREAGILLTGISVPEDRMVHGAANILEGMEQPFLVCIVDEESAWLCMLHQGRCHMQSRFHRTREERENGNVEELWEKLYAAKQFCTSQTDVGEVEHLILIGLKEAERMQMEQAGIKTGISVQCFRPARYVRKHMEEMPILFLAVMDTEGNHMDILKAGRKNKVRTLEKRMPAIPGIREGVMLFLCLLVLFIAIRVGNERLGKELLELQAVSEQEDNRMQYYAELEREKQMERLSRGIEELYTLKQMPALKEPDGRLLAEIETIQGAETQFDYQYSKKDQMLTFSCITEDYRRIPDYMEKLENLSALDEVVYTGYERIQEGNEYRFDVSCRIREGSGE